MTLMIILPSGVQNKFGWHTASAVIPKLTSYRYFCLCKKIKENIYTLYMMTNIRHRPDKKGNHPTLREHNIACITIKLNDGYSL